MDVRIAAEKGFCSGVRRAFQMAEEAVRERGSLESLGPIVHNKQVVAYLEERGMSIVESIDQMKGDTLLIPSHGIGRESIKRISDRGIHIIDATCPIVRNAQQVAYRLSQEGYFVIVFGDAFHTEVKGLLSWAGEAATATTTIPGFSKPPRRIGVLSQTTQSKTLFADFLSLLLECRILPVSETRIFDTICEATAKRQQAALTLASQVDMMLVIGGRDSANTKHLAEICRSTGVITYHIETADDLDPTWYEGQGSIGITAGASTPDWVISEVMQKLENPVDLN